MTEGRLVFDGQCGFCTRSVGWVHRLDRKGRIDVVPYQAPGVPESVGATVQACSEAVQYRGEDDRLRGGAEAVNAVLSVVTRTRLPLMLYGVTSGLQERVYQWVADHRGKFPGMTPRCQSHPEECAPAS